MDILTSSAYQQFCLKSSNQILIDCGHTPISLNNEIIVFGKEKFGPSTAEIKTLNVALEVTQNLLLLGKSVTIHFCFADVGNGINPETRQKLKLIINSRDTLSTKPHEYSAIIGKISDKVSININLQSMSH